MRFIALLILCVSLPSLASNLAPEFDGSEVKIIYPCSTTNDISKSEETKSTVVFYEKGKTGLFEQGLIFRLRDGKSQDFTVKYSAPNFSFDENLYQNLRSSNGEFKCEFDVTYHPTKPVFTKSCSYKTSGHSLNQEHLDFITMTGKIFQGFEGQLNHLREVKIESTEWKIKDAVHELFAKKPSLERWTIGKDCRLEASVKVKGPSSSDALKALEALKKAIGKDPSPEQGSKTSWALSL